MIYKLPHDVQITIKDGDWLTRWYTGGLFYEEGMLKYIKALGPRKTFIDAGAFIGNHSLYFDIVCEASAVYAYEPFKESYDYMATNIRDNASIIQAFNIGLADRLGSGTMYGNASNRGMARLVVGIGDTVVSTIDSEVDKHSIECVDIIKIDVEGMGLDVLRGAKNTIERDSPRIFIECEDDDSKESATAFMIGKGYTIGRRFNTTPTYEFYK